MSRSRKLALSMAIMLSLGTLLWLSRGSNGGLRSSSSSPRPSDQTVDLPPLRQLPTDASFIGSPAQPQVDAPQHSSRVQPITVTAELVAVGPDGVPLPAAKAELVGGGARLEDAAWPAIGTLVFEDEEIDVDVSALG